MTTVDSFDNWGFSSYSWFSFDHQLYFYRIRGLEGRLILRKVLEIVLRSILKLPPGSDYTSFFIHLVVQSKSYGPACIPAMCPEGVSECFEMVLIPLYLVIWISIHLDQIEFIENREIGNHLSLLISQLLHCSLFFKGCYLCWVC